MQAICLIAAMLLSAPAPQKVALTVTTSVVREGALHLAVYDSSTGFEGNDELLSVTRTTNGAPLRIEIELPRAGKYVVAAFHDLNGNGKLDTNVFGVPTEPYGFGQSPPSKWRKPVFQEVATPLGAADAPTTISLRKWKEY